MLSLMLTAAAAAQSNDDGWQDLDSLNTEVNAVEATQPQNDEQWHDIDDEIAALNSDIALPSSVFTAGDLIDITVRDADSLSGEFRISPLGTLTLPLIGSVKAAGLEAAQLEEILESLYAADYLVSPQITITTREKIIGQVALKGLINRAQSVPVTSVTSLASIIAKAGGVRGELARLDAIILRPIGKMVRAQRIALDGLDESKKPGPRVLPGDTITILSRTALPEMKDESGRYPLLNRVLSGGSLSDL